MPAIIALPQSKQGCTKPSSHISDHISDHSLLAQRDPSTTSTDALQEPLHNPTSVTRAVDEKVAVAPAPIATSPSTEAACDDEQVLALEAFLKQKIHTLYNEQRRLRSHLTALQSDMQRIIPMLAALTLAQALLSRCNAQLRNRIQLMLHAGIKVQKPLGGVGMLPKQVRCVTGTPV